MQALPGLAVNLNRDVMVLARLRPVGRVLGTLCGGSTPHELALGLALGAVLGLIPKANLTAALLCGLILSLRLNLTAAALGTSAGMGLAPMLSVLAHQIGLTMLALGVLQGFWSWLFRQPVIPWLRLDETLVLGQLLIGLVLAWPLYRVSREALSRLQPSLVAALRRSSVTRIMLGVRLPAERRAA
jgi:uncharacterized protein (TIGR03546 family)